jgi:signal peptidase II
MPETTARSFRWLFWSLAVIGLVLDQASKYGVFAALYNEGEGGKVALVPGAFDLLAQYTRERELGTDLAARLRTVSGEMLPRVNQGALFGMGGDNGALANLTFAVISFLAAGAIIYWSTRRSLAKDRWLCAALGLILAGTLGNLYDRVIFHGVRDFFHWHYAFDWPVFNIADCCLVCGAGMLLLQALVTRPVSAPAPVPEPVQSLETAIQPGHSSSQF